MILVKKRLFILLLFFIIDIKLKLNDEKLIQFLGSFYYNKFIL